MPQSILQSLRLLGDESRIRLLSLLRQEELSVAELQEILHMAQSRISMQLRLLKQGGLVEDRRTGKNILYRLHPSVAARPDLLPLIEAAAGELPDRAADAAALDLILAKRKDRMRAYFDELAGKFGRHYVPGRSWKALAEALLQLMPRQVVADLGAGEGTLSQLLAQRAEHVIAVDNSENMVAFGRELAARHGLDNLDYRHGDLEQLPIDSGSVDLAVFSQSLHHAPHPDRAVQEAWRILRPGGRVVLLDLVKHHFEQAREMYADLWLGFAETELRRYLEEAGFGEVVTSRVYREEQPPHLETVLALGTRL